MDFMIPFSFLSLFLCFAYIYTTGRNPPNITSAFIFMEDYIGFLFSSSQSRFQSFYKEYDFHNTNTMTF